MKFKYRMTSLALVIGLTGCATAFNHTKVSDEQAYRYGQQVAFAKVCVNAGYVKVETGKAFIDSMNQLLRITVHDNSQVHAGHDTAMASPPTVEQIRAECSTAESLLVERIRVNSQEYTKALAWQAQPVPTYTPTTATPTYTPATAPSTPQVTFGEEQKGTDHYLINTKDGQKMCSVAGSGYVNCD